MQTVSTSNKPILVLGGTGNSGRRIVERLRTRGLSVRVGSRSANPPFDWAREDTWDDALTGVSSIYISYAPDLAIPGAKASGEIPVNGRLRWQECAVRQSRCEHLRAIWQSMVSR